MSALLITILFASGGAPEADDLVIIDQGRTDYEIVVESTSLSTTRLAAIELRSYLRDATGVKLEIVEAPTAGHRQIYVKSTSHLKPHGFAIQAHHGDLYLRGHDSGGDDHTVDFHRPIHRGTCNAVYEFLERFAGVRWFWDDSLGEIVPKLSRIVVPSDLSIKQEPSFDYRVLAYGPPGSYHGNWARHNRLGAQSGMHHAHALHKLVPVEYWAKHGHPEYGPLRGNTRRAKPGSHVCTGNPEVVAVTADALMRAFASHPEVDMFSMVPPDNPYLCTCNLCTRYDDPSYVARFGRRKGWVVATDRMLHFYNSVASIVAQRFPDRLMGAYAYMHYVYPPHRVKRIHPNVALFVTPNMALILNQREIKSFYEELFPAWGGMHDRVYSYDIWWRIRHMYGFPAPHGDRIPELIKLLVESGIRGAYHYIGSTWEAMGPDAYILAKLLWDPQTDAERIRREYYGLLYQQAAPAVRGYFEVAERSWAEATTADDATVESLAQAFHRSNDWAREPLARLLLGYAPHLRELERYVVESEEAVAGNDLLERRVRRLRDNYTLVRMTLDGLKAVVDYERDPARGGEALARLGRAITERQMLMNRLEHGYSSGLVDGLRYADENVKSPLEFGGYYHKLSTP